MPTCKSCKKLTNELNTAWAAALISTEQTVKALQLLTEAKLTIKRVEELLKDVKLGVTAAGNLYYRAPGSIWRLSHTMRGDLSFPDAIKSLIEKLSDEYGYEELLDE